MAKSGLRNSAKGNQFVPLDDTVEAASYYLGVEWRANGAYTEYVS